MTKTDRESGMRVRVPLALLILLLAGGCGLKDDLYIPVEEPAGEEEQEEDAPAEAEPAP